MYWESGTVGQNWDESKGMISTTYNANLEYNREVSLTNKKMNTQMMIGYENQYKIRWGG